MAYPPQGVVREGWERYPHTDITEKIVAYREGKISFAELYDGLSKRDYDPMPHYHGGPLDMHASDDADRFEPGTTGELDQAHAMGMLTDVEFEAIVSGALTAHGHGD